MLKSKFCRARGHFRAQLARFRAPVVSQTQAILAMASVESAASSVVHVFLGLYLMLWNTLKTVIGGLYSALRTLSQVYPPAKQFLNNVEKTVHQLKTDPSAGAELNPQNLLQQFWTPSTTLEGLGQISIAVPVSLAVLCTTGSLLFASLLVTCMFAVCVSLCLPVGLCCATGYIIGTVTQQLVDCGLRVSGFSALGSSVRCAMSQVLRQAKSGKSTNTKNHISNTTDDKTSSDASEQNSPKISATVEKDAGDVVQFVH